MPSSARVGNEELENWLLRLLTPRIDFRFYELALDDKPVVLLEISPAYRHPIRLKGQEFVRVGSYKKLLKDFPEKERELWRRFDNNPFDIGIAHERATEEEVLQLLDYTAYFKLLGRPVPADRATIIQALRDDDLLQECDAGGWSITNMAAVLFAARLDAFPTLRRMAIRVIQYRGTSRIETMKEQVGVRGYASGFEGLIEYINRYRLTRSSGRNRTHGRDF